MAYFFVEKILEICISTKGNDYSVSFTIMLFCFLSVLFPLDLSYICVAFDFGNFRGLVWWITYFQKFRLSQSILWCFFQTWKNEEVSKSNTSPNKVKSCSNQDKGHLQTGINWSNIWQVSMNYGGEWIYSMVACWAANRYLLCSINHPNNFFWQNTRPANIRKLFFSYSKTWRNYKFAWNSW